MKKKGKAKTMPPFMMKKGGDEKDKMDEKGKKKKKGRSRNMGRA